MRPPNPVSEFSASLVSSQDEVEAPVEQRSTRASEQRRARDLFEAKVSADPTNKPDAAAIWRELDLESNPGTVRRWVRRWWDEYAEPADASSRLVKLVVYIRQGDVDRLTALADRVGHNRATVLVRALRILDTLVRSESEGAEVRLHFAGGRRERLVLFGEPAMDEAQRPGRRRAWLRLLLPRRKTE